MPRPVKNLASLFVAVVAMATISVNAFAGALNLDSNGVAIMGYDPVAYFAKSEPLMGLADFSVTHDGATYWFSSADNKAAFEADPVKYLPAYGGYCAYGMSQGYKAPIDPQAFTVVDGQLYLNYSTGVRDTWQKDIPGYISKANENWTQLGG